MSVGEPFLEHLRDLLAGLGPVRSKRMFGAVGLYADELFFAIADEDVLYLKADDQTRSLFEAAGARPFVYSLKDGMTGSMSYWSLPDAALDDPDEAVRWSRLALDAARRAQAGKAKRRR